MNSPVTCIVINWNLEEETLRCLSSIESSTIACRIILVDNGSSDGSVKEISKKFPGVITIQLPNNIGFGPACNLGIQYALQDSECRYILLLNNDAFINPTTIETLLETTYAYPNAGIFGPIVYDQKKPTHIWYAGAQRRPGILSAYLYHRGELDRGQFLIKNVDYVFGAAMFIRRSVFEEIGLFDERFFLYLEDLDFCLRAENAGYALLFVPKARVWHFGSASTAHNLALRRYHHIRSTILFLRKYALRLSLIPAVIFWFLVLLRALLLDLIKGDLSFISSYASAILHGMNESSRLYGESSD